MSNRPAATAADDADDVPRAEFERAVERVVGRLRAGPRRKAVMREELLAHLLGVFAQELDRTGDGPASIEATIRRFGSIDELSTELQASVPAPERIAAVILNKEHRMWRLLVLGGFLVTLFGITMVLPALAKIKHLGALAGKGEPLMMLVVGVGIGVAVVMIGLHLLAWGVARRVRKTA